MPRGAWFVRPGRAFVVYGPRLTQEELEQLHSGDDAAFCELARQRVADCVAKATLSETPGFCDNEDGETRGIEQ